MNASVRGSVVLIVAFFVMIFVTRPSFAQDPRPPDQPGQGGTSGTTANWQVLAGADGFTTWRKDINNSCSYADHDYTLDIPQDPQFMSDISYSMTNNDVDYNDPQGCEGGPEVDHMKFNGRFLGILTGANNSWSVNSWPLQKSDIISGSNQVFIDTDAPGTGCWCVGVGYIEVKAKVGFKVLDKTPQDKDKNRDFHKAAIDLTVTFSSDYDPATLTAATFKLEYRNQGGAWTAVTGKFTPLSPKKFRFEPDADLKDGVRYRATVKSGDAGVKGKGGATLDADTAWEFWTVPDLAQTDAFDYGSGSVCPPSTSPCAGLEIAVFQVARNANMVPQKDAVARLYLRWKKHADVHADDQVKELEADASITVGGVKTTVRETLKRPDQYTAAQKQAAGNTINLYHKPATTFNYTAEVIPFPQTNTTPVKYNQALNLTSKGNSPKIEFPYYFLNDGAWSTANGGVPAAAKTAGVNLMTSGVQFVTDQFPVLETAFTQKGDYSIGYTVTITTVNYGSCGTVRQVLCPAAGGGAPTAQAELLCAYEKLQTLRGGSKFVGATVPNGLCVGATAFAMGDKVFMHQSGGGANDGTVAHEIGHIYGISPANSPTNKHRNDSTKVEGFQVRTKTNRSYVENQSKAISLMHTTVQPAGTQWIDNGDYTVLLGAVNVFSVQSAATAAGPYLIIGGYVNSTTTSARLAYAFLQNEANDPPSATGSCRVELLDGSNNVLASDNVTPGVEIETFGQTGSGVSSAGVEDLEAFFTVSLPWNESAQQIQISCGGPVLLTESRSASAPTVDFVGLTNNDTLSGVQTISWTGSDADGPNLAYQLQWSEDNGATWRPLHPLAPATTLDLNTTLLAAGTSKQVRVMVTDGFNTAYATRTVNVVNSLTVLGVSPGVDDQNAGVDGPVSALFVSAIATPTITANVFTVYDESFNIIQGSVTYNAGSRTLSFAPATQLTPSRNYTAVIDGGLQDMNGNGLAAAYQWSFRTITDTVAPYVVSTNPQDGELNAPLNTLIQARFNEPMAAATLTAATFQVTDNNGAAVAGLVSYNADLQAVIFIAATPLAANTMYIARVTTDVTDAAGNPLAAAYQWSFTTGTQTIANGLRIIGNYSDLAVDRNGDNLYDDLVISVDVEVQSDSAYNLNGRLVDKNGELILWATSGDLVLTTGVHRLALTFQSIPIRSNGVSGPYLLDSLNFYNTFNPLLADQQNSAFQSFAYDVTAFFSILTLGGLPDQLLEINTTRDNAFNLRTFTTHRTQPLTDMTYTILINTNPAVGLSIDAEANIDINPPADTQAESDVTIEAKDSLGNRVVSAFHISVQQARLTTLVANAPASLGTNAVQPIHVDIHDQFERPFLTASSLTFTSTLGTTDPVSLTTASGAADFTFRSGNTTGPAFITVQSGNASTQLNIQIVEVAVATVEITGPTTGVAGTPATFTATTSPAGTTRPISYTWQATAQTPVSSVDALTSSATFQWTKAGAQTISVDASNRAGNANASFTIAISAGAPASIAASASPGSLPGDGISTSTIRATLLDAFGNPVPGQTVTFETSLGAITPSATTDANGVATATFTAARGAGTAVITTRANGLTSSSNIVLRSNSVFLPLIRR